ncbi:MAG: imidazoleglycerol-phosphate dehydratase HisB [Candidatus Margulisiibacteriota bacterium]
MNPRKASIERKTSETQVQLSLNLDGEGHSTVNTGIGFFDHMLTLFARHGLFDLNLAVQGDLHVDAHHTVEDAGICLGQAFKEALGTGVGIERYASILLPMDETLCQVAVDISNRPHLSFKAPQLPNTQLGDFGTELAKEFLIAFVNNAKITLHMTVLEGENAHHIIEGCFKGLARTLRQAVSHNPREKNVPSTKGVL